MEVARSRERCADVQIRRFKSFLHYAEILSHFSTFGTLSYGPWRACNANIQASAVRKRMCGVQQDVGRLLQVGSKREAAQQNYPDIKVGKGLLGQHARDNDAEGARANDLLYNYAERHRVHVTDLYSGANSTGVRHVCCVSTT